MTALVDSYVRVWNEASPQVQADLLMRIWADGGTYTDPTVHVANGAELLKHIAAVRARRPGASVSRTTAVDAHHGVARFGWQVVQADGAVVVEGIDIAQISADGERIERIIGFFGPLAAAE